MSRFSRCPSSALSPRSQCMIGQYKTHATCCPYNSITRLEMYILFMGSHSWEMSRVRGMWRRTWGCSDKLHSPVCPYFCWAAGCYLVVDIINRSWKQLLAITINEELTQHNSAFSLFPVSCVVWRYCSKLSVYWPGNLRLFYLHKSCRKMLIFIETDPIKIFPLNWNWV
jgi:hypothetical protein